jgi:N-acetyl-alpha-D-muramate 1-phosphate uridylyltransferase
VLPAVVIAAGLGTRLRPLTEHFPKPVLPLDGKPVVAALLRELAAAGCADVTLVVGYRGEQVERLVGDGAGFGLTVRYARQEEPLGSAHAVVAAAPRAPYVIAGADTLFTAGDVGRFVSAFAASGADGALAVEEGRVGTVVVRDGLVERVQGAAASGVSGAPLWAVGSALAPRVAALPGEAPFELRTAFQEAIDAGERVAAIPIGATRDLTAPVDLLVENFVYLRAL